ncbi:DUF1479 family protein [Streptosporangiaceae bacterium NEAU-GS5]|nr:DUF1479 family protein [Streptosporangiaceae bacterium NEAU-GS5]
MPTSAQYLHRASCDIPYSSADGATYSAETPLRGLVKSLPLRVLSPEDFEFWQTYGYVVVPRAIAPEAAAALLDFLWDFQGMDPLDPESWYAERPYRSDLDRELHIYGFVEAYHHQLIWDSRQAPRVYDAFADVWDCEQLWVSLDRLNLNPPNVRNRDRKLIAPTDSGFDINLHWDVDSTQSVQPQRVQGIIALTDTEEALGGFQCCPELFRNFDRWKVGQPADRDPVRPAISRDEYPVVRPRLHAGDLLIWNGMLAHGVAANTSERGVRAAQYLSMMPALETHHELRRSRVDSWRTLSTPDWDPTLVGDGILHESQRYGPAALTELGEKLLGLRSWHGGAGGGAVEPLEEVQA